MKNVVVMFPYPSGDGLHMGHVYNYAVMDSYCRFLRHQGEEVSQPFGYDAFGLPAENYARKVGRDPREVTYENIARFREQMTRLNTQYTEKLVTSDPSYYRWTQWLFLKLHERGLAYKAEGKVNWCNRCGTVLANEQVQPFDPQFPDGPQKCERCEFPVEKRVMVQWYFKITDYKDRLLKGLETLNYPAKTIKQQKQWLENLRDWCVSRQRKWGCPIPIEGETDTLDTFVDSSFYYLRYLSQESDLVHFLAPNRYRPVDLYVGGPEHACMHLIYARFIHYFLYDLGVVPQEEPFNRVFHQGMITRNGAKMGKSKGNAVNPDEYDPDVLRLHLMFIGPYDEGGEWNDRNIVGIERFLARMGRWLSALGTEKAPVGELVEKIDGHVKRFKFNKVVSSFMEFYNAHKGKVLDPDSRDAIVRLLQCFAPGFDWCKETAIMP